MENNVASEVHVKRFKSKEVGIKKLRKTLVFPSADGSLKTRRSRTTSNLTPQKVESFDAGRASTSGEARGDSLQCAKVASLQEDGGIVF